MSASLVWGLVLVAFTWAIAWPLAWALGRPEFPKVFLALSSVLVLQSLSFPLHGMLRRELNLRAIAICTLTATTVGGVTAATLALNGFGPWALVAQELIVASVGLIMLLRVSKDKPWPFHFTRESFEPLIAVARPVMLGQFAKRKEKERLALKQEALEEDAKEDSVEQATDEQSTDETPTALADQNTTASEPAQAGNHEDPASTDPAEVIRPTDADATLMSGKIRRRPNNPV